MSTLCNDHWDLAFRLDDYCKEELYFWKENLMNINSRHCFVNKSSSYFLFSDASATSCGSVIGFNNDFVCHKMWTELESLQSSSGGSYMQLNFLCSHSPQCLKGHVSNGLLIIKPLPESFNWTLMIGRLPMICFCLWIPVGDLIL